MPNHVPPSSSTPRGAGSASRSPHSPLTGGQSRLWGHPTRLGTPQRRRRPAAGGALSLPALLLQPELGREALLLQLSGMQGTESGLSTPKARVLPPQAHRTVIHSPTTTLWLQAGVESS